MYLLCTFLNAKLIRAKYISIKTIATPRKHPCRTLLAAVKPPSTQNRASGYRISMLEMLLMRTFVNARLIRPKFSLIYKKWSLP